MTLRTNSIRQLADVVRSGARTFAEINDEAIANRSEELGAYRHTDDDLVRAHAAAADDALASGDDHGPLMGMPVSVKDLFGVPGFPVHAGSPMALPAEFSEAGPVVASLEARSAVITGKTHTCLLYTSPSPRDQRGSRMPSSA